MPDIIIGSLLIIGVIILFANRLQALYTEMGYTDISELVDWGKK